MPRTLQELFVNRTRQLEAFRKMLSYSIARRVMAITANAGMGKSWLLSMFRHEAHARSLPVAQVDFADGREYDEIQLMGRIVEQLGAEHFPRFQYVRAQSRLFSQSDTSSFDAVLIPKGEAREATSRVSSTLPSNGLTQAQRTTALRRIDALISRFGEAHYYFALHASVPIALTPDLLYQLWSEFRVDILGNPLHIPWVAVADLLLSSLCIEVGHELYEIEAHVRTVLLERMQTDQRFSEQRVRELASFIIDYVRPHLQSSNLEARIFAEAEYWTALVHIRPRRSAQGLARSFQSIDLEDAPEVLRMTSLVQTIAAPLQQYETLTAYADSMAHYSHGNLERAVGLLRPLLQNDHITVAEVELPIPDKLRSVLDISVSMRLSDAFFQDLKVLSQHTTVVLLFDTYERLLSDDERFASVSEWIVDELINRIGSGELATVVVALAGRRVPAFESELSSVVGRMSLDILLEGDVGEYLRERRGLSAITDAELQKLYTAIAGNPTILGIIGDNLEQANSPRADDDEW